MAKKRKVDSELDSLDHDTAATDSVTDSDSDEEEDLAKTLEPFNKEQLIDLLRSAASTDPRLTEEIHRVADSDPAHRKLFVHGLGWETTSDKLTSFFVKYGELEDCNVVVDKASGKSKGYGFLLFKHRRDARKALRHPQKKIDGRMTACQLASAGPVQPQHQQGPPGQQKDVLARKIYVGNVNPDIPTSKLLAFFSKYGEIEEGPLGFDKQTGKSKGFALFIYKTVEGARKALEEPNKSFDGHQLYCQKATDSNKLRAGTTTAATSANNVPAHPGPTGFNGSGGGGSNLGYGAPDMAASAALLGQGFLSGALPFGGQGIMPSQAALALLAAAGQNPAAFGATPAMLASLNPAAVAAAMSMGAAPQVAGSTIPQALQGFGMGNVGYQNTQGHQGANSYQNPHIGHGSGPRPHSGIGPMGGYASR